MKRIREKLLCLLLVSFCACSALTITSCSFNSSSSGSSDLEDFSEEGLAYILSKSGTYYTVSGIGNCTDTNIVIPSSYKNLPVTSIGDSAFDWCGDLKIVYYKGKAEDWSMISINSNNSFLSSATIYYYSETEPTEAGNYWHYDTDGVTIVTW